jgi:hypothetical protein
MQIQLFRSKPICSGQGHPRELEARYLQLSDAEVDATFTTSISGTAIGVFKTLRANVARLPQKSLESVRRRWIRIPLQNKRLERILVDRGDRTQVELFWESMQEANLDFAFLAQT